MKEQLRIAIVVGETSGDILGAGLIRELNKRHPNIVFQGIGGSLMEKEGFHSDADMARLSIMGFDGLLGSLREILAIRRSLQQSLITNPPDVFIGIDAPDFNLTLEKRLRDKGIQTIHYVSPTVWAWRNYRIHKIRKAVDLMLALFPFEQDYYQKRRVPVQYVGHPLAKTLNPNFDETDIDLRIRQLRRNPKTRFVGVLPGSRKSEINTLAELFILSMERIKSSNPDVEFIVPLANKAVADLFVDYFEQSQADIRSFVHLVDGTLSADVMRISDVMLLASGTAALEAALLGKPMVVSYKISTLTYWFAKSTSTVKHVSMPNNLLDKPIVPELLQNDATAENLSSAVNQYLEDDVLYTSTRDQLLTIQPMLDVDSNQKAAEAVMSFLELTT